MFLWIKLTYNEVFILGIGVECYINCAFNKKYTEEETYSIVKILTFYNFLRLFENICNCFIY